MPDSIDQTRELVAILNTVFQKLDRNHDQVLQPGEVDIAVIDPLLSAEFSEAVAVLKAGFADIQHLHKEGWFARKNGITLADLLVFERLLLMEDTEGERAQHSHLLNLAQVIHERVLQSAHLKRQLFENPSAPLASICPEAIRQGLVGDCYFLAALGSVVATNPQIVTRIIGQNSDNSYTVTFPGARDEPITIEPPGLIELSLYAKITHFGIWPCVLEKAYGQFLISHGYKRTVIPTDATEAAQHVYEAFDLITGQMGRWQLVSELDDEEISKSFSAAFKEQRAVAAASLPSARGDRDVTADGLPSQHAYSVLAWKPKTRQLTLRNPWGQVSDRQNERGALFAEEQCPDGVFTMTLDQLRRNFVAIYYEDWLPDQRYI